MTERLSSIWVRAVSANKASYVIPISNETLRNVVESWPNGYAVTTFSVLGHTNVDDSGAPGQVLTRYTIYVSNGEFVKALQAGQPGLHVSDNSGGLRIFR